MVNTFLQRGDCMYFATEARSRASSTSGGPSYLDCSAPMVGKCEEQDETVTGQKKMAVRRWDEARYAPSYAVRNRDVGLSEPGVVPSEVEGIVEVEGHHVLTRPRPLLFLRPRCARVIAEQACDGLVVCHSSSNTMYDITIPRGSSRAHPTSIGRPRIS